VSTPQEVLKLLKKIAKQGFVRERDLDEKERELARKLAEHGILEVGYAISPDYVQDIVKICKVPALTLPYRRLRKKVARIALPVAFAAFPAYIATVGLVIGCPSVAALFYTIALGLAYGGYVLALKFFK